MASITDFPTAGLTWSDATDKGTFRLKRVLHRNNGGGSKSCINAQKVWVLPEDGGDSDDDEECAFVPKKQRVA